MLKALLGLVFPTVLVGALSFATTAIIGPESPPAQWVNWGGESFASPGRFGDWLEARGLSYETWAENHPLAAARLEGREPPAAAATTTTTTTATRPGAETSAPAPEPAGSAESAPVIQPSGSSVGDRLILLMLVAVACGLIALSALPVPLLHAIRAPELVAQHRLELATAGVSIAIGMAAAQLLSR